MCEGGRGEKETWSLGDPPIPSPVGDQLRGERVQSLISLTLLPLFGWAI